MLRTRVLTAVILAPLAVWLVWGAPSWVLGVAVIAVMTAAGWEWSRLAGLTMCRGRALYTLACALACGLAWWASAVITRGGVLAGITLAWWALPVARLTAFARSGGRLPPHDGLDAIAGVATLAAACGAIMVVEIQTTAAPVWLTVLLVLVWGGDIGGYFAGRRWGRRRLAPTISPGKTWAGVGGGLVLGLAAAALVALLGDWIPGEGRLPFSPWLPVAGVVTIALSIVGDLFESMLKRQRGLKDSGQMLPGHGGLLDRIDALLAAAPVVAVAAFVLAGGAHA
ncbi:phosphatidate cytidylyltransferase [Arhodomonas aquaeolei]|uniref:phosphatidate cytidylyltransferase n=1 Tax=Arhodomonas aquaeolei TaxID=2369 RepID=UPI002168BB51|nr:phosphatidate cytidylyltransferase [Arhodomonas aquaeolei]MCS4505657.1 phosphatidate cytidylyltransferase [Arhodomonas aquaeolei]